MFSDTVDFDSAKVNVDLIMLSATFAGNLNLFGVFVGSGLATDHADFRGDVVLRNASVGKTLSMTDASFAKTLSAEFLEVGGSLLMFQKSRFSGEVTLNYAKIAHVLAMNSSTFEKNVSINSVSVGGSCPREWCKSGG